MADQAFMHRMGLLIERAGSVDELARKSRLSARVLRKYRDGESDPSRERVLRIAASARVSVLWLSTGEGSMDPPRSDGVNGGSALEGEYVALPRYDVAAAAGAGASVVSEGMVDALYFRRDWLHREIGTNLAALVVIGATGDSMAPTIEDGDLLVVDTSQHQVASDGVYVIGVEDSIWVKRIARRTSGGLVVSSDNPRYAHTTEAIERADSRSLRIVGRVVWVGGRI